MLNNLTHRPFDPGISKVKVCSVENYLLHTKQRAQTRCGIIPYIKINDRFYFCFGKDSKSGDYTDFGGSIHKNEDPVNCAIREFYEESRGVFGKLDAENIQKCKCIYNKKMLIILIDIFNQMKVDSSLNLLKNSLSDFRSMIHIPEELRLDPRFNEIKAISWLDENIMEDVFVNNGYSIKVYTRVRKFLRSYKEFSYTLDSMKTCIY